MSREQAQRVVGDAAAWPQQDHRYGLMRDLIDVGREAVLSRHEVQAAVDHTQLSALKPQQAVPVGVGDACGLKPKATFQHAEGGRRSSIPNPKARWRPTPRAISAAKPAGSRTVSSPENNASGPVTR